MFHVPYAGLVPLAGDHHHGAHHGGHARGVGNGLRTQLMVAFLMVADVVDVHGAFLAVLHAAHEAADARFAHGARAEGGGIGQEFGQELEGNDVVALELHRFDTDEAHVLEHLQVVQIRVAEGHPETGAAYATEVLHQRFQLFMIHEVAVALADAFGEVEVHLPGKGIGFHPFAAFPVAALGRHFAQVDFRVEVGGERQAVVASVGVDDVQNVDFIQQVLLGVGAEHVGHAGVEAGAEQGAESGILEFLLVGPLPFVFEMRVVRRFVVGGVQIVHARFKAGVHDVQILIGQGDVHDEVGLHAADESREFGHVVGVHLSGFNVAAVAFLHACGDGVAFGFRAARQHDVGKDFSGLRALVRGDGTDAAGADDQHFCHVLAPCSMKASAAESPC